MTKAKQKTESAPTALPPGWEWDMAAMEKVDLGYRAICPIEGGRTLQTIWRATALQAIESAHQVEAARREDLVGLAGKGLVSRSLEANGNGEPSLEKALYSALHSVQGAAERWRPLQQIGATDAVLTKAIADEWGLGGGSSTQGGYSYKGGRSPEFAWPNPADAWTAQILKGKRLLAKAREILGIGAPGQFVHGDLREAVEDGGMGFQPGFPPGFDVKRAERGLAQEDKGGAGELAAPAASNGYHPQMLRMIPLDRIIPSPTNPRKHFDPDKLRELADSIIEHGLVEPILVRSIKLVPIPGGEYDDESFETQYYELVVGERRYRAAKLAGLTVIEAKVRDLDDRAALEIQFIENLQRVDVLPAEEADGYAAMLALKNEDGTNAYTVDSLAAKIGKRGKSKSYVYSRLKLRNLPPAALEALARGDLPATVGELIGRLPSMEMRQEFWDEEFEGYGSDWFEMPSFRDVKETVERSYMRELKGVPFSRTDGKLVSGVPSCKNCSKMTGNNRAEYPDARADMCTDVPCYQRKVQAHAQREAEKAKRAGANVLGESETKKIFQGTENSSWLTSEGRQKYFELDDTPWQTDDERTYKELLDGHLTPVVAVDQQGNSHLLAPRAEAEKILKEIHGIKPERERGADTYRKEEQKRQEEKKLRQATAAEIVERALRDDGGEALENAVFLRLVARFLIDHGDADVARAIVHRRDVKYDQAHVRGAAAKIVDGLTNADVRGMIVEWLIQRELEFWAQWGGDRGDKFPLCDYFGLKPQAVMKEVAAKQKAEAKTKPKPKAKALAQA